MDGKITYHQQVSYCGKPRCRRCREGIGHGPYWYAYRVVNGRTVRTYIGKELPPDIQASLESERETSVASASPAQSNDLEEAIIRIYTLGQFRLERRDAADWQTVTEAAWKPVFVIVTVVVAAPAPEEPARAATRPRSKSNLRMEYDPPESLVVVRDPYFLSRSGPGLTRAA